MELPHPSLQQSETDGTGPLRRRRPALSCVECRRRKVKCDREKPCGPCTRIKSETCTYRLHPRAGSQRVASPPGTGAGASSSTSVVDGGNSASPRTSPRSSVQRDFESMLNRYIAPGIFGAHGKEALGPLHVREEGGMSEGLVRELVERVKGLEARLGMRIETRALEEDMMGSESRIARDLGMVDIDNPAAQFVKSRFYGGSHWNNCLEPYSALGGQSISVDPTTNRTVINKSSELYATGLDCKKMARALKASRMLPPSLTSEVLESLPAKSVCDALVQCYLRTFESVWRILHIPSFMEEYEAYWTRRNGGNDEPKPSVMLKMLLVCSIGVPFYVGEGDEQPRLRVAATKWIQAASTWLSAPHEKSRLNMAGLQIQILLLLARQVCSVDGDLVWVPAGTLLRSAMHLGLHRDPERFGRMSTFHREMRRRLWYTVLEVTAQSALDVGMPPMIEKGDWDTRPPANVDDEELTDGDPSVPLQSKPQYVFTQTSIQIAMAETLPFRLEIVRSINNLRFSLSYDETLRIGSELLKACRKSTQLFQSFPSSTSLSKPNAFQIKLFDTLTRRFVLCLHRPFFAKAKDNPKYYYSRKICLDTALTMVAPMTLSHDKQEDDWTRLLHHAVGFIKSFFLHTLATVFLELLSLLEEQQESGLGTLSLPQTSQYQLLRDVLVSTKYTAEQRLRNGETNPKGTVFLSGALARVDAMASGTDPDAAVLAAAKKAVNDAAEMMKAAYKAEHGVDIEFGLGRGPFAGRDHGRGEGADEVFGTPDGRHEGAGGEGAGVEGPWSDGMGEDMDWETLMQDESLDFGFGFEGSPESWFGWGWEGGAGIGM